MPKLVQAWELDGNFWDMHKHLLLVPTFSELYENDSSKGKKDSSQIMWAVALYCDSKSDYRELTESNKQEFIIEGYLKSKWTKADLEPYMVAYLQFNTPLERQLYLIERVIEEKNQYMSGLNYADNGDELEKRIKSNAALVEALDRVKLSLAEQSDEGVIKGGAEESAAETGEI